MALSQHTHHRKLFTMNNTLDTPYTLLITSSHEDEGRYLIFLEPRGTKTKIPDGLSFIGIIPLERTLRDLRFPPSGISLFLIIISVTLSNPTLYGQGKAIIESFLTEGYHRHRNPRGDPSHPEKQHLEKVSLSKLTYEQSSILWKKMATNFIEAIVHYEAIEIIYKRIDRLIAEEH
jgi:hypothetical protein